MSRCINLVTVGFPRNLIAKETKAYKCSILVRAANAAGNSPVKLFEPRCLKEPEISNLEVKILT